MYQKKGKKGKIKCLFAHAREYTKERYCTAKERSKPELDEEQQKRKQTRK
jgi:hypothetical protein